jgi:putative membrane protein
MVYHYGWNDGNWWLMLLWMLLFWGGLLTLGFFLARGLFGTLHSTMHYPPDTVSQSAKKIAQERYARGEISRDQYLEIIQDVEHPPA